MVYWKHVKRCEDGREQVLFLRAKMRMFRCPAFEAILQLARRNDRKTDDALAVGGELSANGVGIRAQQIDPHCGVEQVHGAYSVALSNSLSRPTRGRWSCWRSSAKSRGNSSRAANSPAQRSPALGVSTMELPRRFTWTLFPVTRYSLGSLTAWLRPVIKTFASATAGRDPVFRDGLCCFLSGLVIILTTP